jgi:predicted enzyme related to lactoylglutathione lyase
LKTKENKNKKVANSDFFLFKATTQCKRFQSTPDLEKCKRFHESVFKMVGKGLGPEQQKSPIKCKRFQDDDPTPKGFLSRGGAAKNDESVF